MTLCLSKWNSLNNRFRLCNPDDNFGKCKCIWFAAVPIICIAIIVLFVCNACLAEVIISFEHFNCMCLWLISIGTGGADEEERAPRADSIQMAECYSRKQTALQPHPMSMHIFAYDAKTYHSRIFEQQNNILSNFGQSIFNYQNDFVKYFRD